VKNLIFYNKEGYPYNFTYNDENEKWEGKLLFDPNSTDLYKTVGIYMFENVDPITYSGYFDFHKFELFNVSGITFRSETKQNIPISNIKKSNDSPDFHTKWIYGKAFHQLFPVGTLVRFDNITGTNITTDFNPTFEPNFNLNVYYNVLAVKKDAFLVETVTANSGYTGVFTSGTVSTYNGIKYPDYNQGLSYSTPDIYLNKKLSIINSELNDGVKSLFDYKKSKRSIYDYVLSGNTGEYISLELELLTDRPLLYNGSFNVSGNTFTFDTPINRVFEEGQNIIFEDNNGNQLLGGLQYDVIDIIKEKDIITTFFYFFSISDLDEVDEVEYYVQFQGYSPYLKVDDVIYFTDNSSSWNDNKDYKILNVTYESGYTRLQLEQYVFPEGSNPSYGPYFTMVKKLKYYEYDTIIASGTTAYASLTGNCYLTTNKLYYRQEILEQTSGYTQYEETIKSFVTVHNNELNSFGVNSYYYDNKLIIEGLHDYNFSPYFKTQLMQQNVSGIVLNFLSCEGDFSNISLSGETEIHNFITNERLYNEKVLVYETNKTANNYHEEILFNLKDDSIDYGFMLTINDVEYYIQYQDISGTTTTTQETIKDFVNKYYTALYNKGIVVSSGSTVDHILYIDTLYPNVRIVDLKVKVNSFSTYQLLYKDQNEIIENPILITGNELRVSSINPTNLFDIGFSTGMVISVTGNTFNENQKEYNILGLSNKVIQLSYQGAFFNDISKIITITSREYIRKPRESYDKDIYYRVSWLNTIDNIYDESMFFYDISGEQLKPPTDSAGNYITQLTYTGIKPLYDAYSQNVVRLNNQPNKKIEWINNPKYQQTVFDKLEFLLPQYDSSEEFNYLPEPIPIFIGYNYTDEGVNSNVIKIHKVENLVLSGISGELDNYFIFNTDGTIEFKSNTFNGFNNYGFEIGQLIQIKMTDTSQLTGQTIFENIEVYKITNVYKNKITIDKNIIQNNFVYFNTSGKTFNYSISVVPKEIASFSIFGETENEDERFDINLKNLGININKEEEFIFKESDINEYGIDYTLLNRKRKEMLILYPDIYNYIGSYKSLINAINYFGYADLELYEYYKNVNKNSPFYKKFFRVHIPDIFDKSIDGWSEYDYIKTKGNRNNYQKTNLFNLTYKITDEEGNNLNLYSLQEVQTKLQALKVWLRENILPLASNIQDITGVAKTPTTIYRKHDVSNNVNKIVVNASCAVVNFNYIATLNFSTNYLFTINFYTTTGEVPDHFELIVKTFSKDSDGKLIPVQYFKLLKNNLNSFNLSIDKMIDPYIYVETIRYNDYGVGIKNKKLFKYDEPKSYYLVNNNFRYKYYPRISTNLGYYIIDDDGQIWIVEEYSPKV
jgi:tRNA-binding EMAP/Myf-like protein